MDLHFVLTKLSTYTLKTSSQERNKISIIFDKLSKSCSAWVPYFLIVILIPLRVLNSPVGFNIYPCWKWSNRNYTLGQVPQ